MNEGGEGFGKWPSEGVVNLCQCACNHFPTLTEPESVESMSFEKSPPH